MDRVKSIEFDGISLDPDDPKLDWFSLAGTSATGGPYPPDFAFSPFDRTQLQPRQPFAVFDAPFGCGNGFAELVRNASPAPAPATLRSSAHHRIVNFAKAHSDFFACGATPVLHAASDEGVIEWFSNDDLLNDDLPNRGAETPLVGHGYGPPLGRLPDPHRRGIAAGTVGFATVADDRPIWVRATPFGASRQSRDVCPCDRALGAPIRLAGGFVWPISYEGRVRMAVRADAVEAPWSHREVARPAPPADLAPPCRLDGDVAAWVGEEGYLIGHATDWSWHRWPEGFRALTPHRPHLDAQGGAWQFGTAPSGYAFAKLSSGGQDLVPTNGHHVEGTRFTIQGTDLLERPVFDDRDRRTIRAIDGKLAVPVLDFEDGAIVALSSLSATAGPEDYLSAPGGPPAVFDYWFLSRTDCSLTNLHAGMMKWTRRRDLQAFVFAGRLFLTSSWEKRCVVYSA
ncbi:MAG: hypothetical protein GX458_17340 [Phyllobacteriaceae bacterium]|nr:hypothetical protein [Phyllobacteriaceae bacterium]